MKLADPFCVLCMMVFFGSILSPAQAGTRHGSLQLALAAAADYSPVYPLDAVPQSLRELSAVFRLGEGESYQTLTGTWIAVDVGSAAPPNYQIAATELRLGHTADRGRFHYEQPGPLPVGKYRLDVTADGRPWAAIDFSVVPDSMDPSEGTDGILQLSEGRSWIYSYLQEAGPGARITGDGVELDAEGRLRATVSLTMAGQDDAGARIELWRDAALVQQEWWQLSAHGLFATRRQSGGKITDLVPAQLLVPLPLSAPQSWSYVASDGSFSQHYQMWGPLPVAGPVAEVPGYVVLVKEPPDNPVVSAERHLVPGIGFVREIVIQAVAGRLVSRSEMILREMR